MRVNSALQSSCQNALALMKSCGKCRPSPTRANPGNTTPLGVYHTSALTKCVRIDEEEKPVVENRRRGRPPKCTAGSSAGRYSEPGGKCNKPHATDEVVTKRAAGQRQPRGPEAIAIVQFGFFSTTRRE